MPELFLWADGWRPGAGGGLISDLHLVTTDSWLVKPGVYFCDALLGRLLASTGASMVSIPLGPTDALSAPVLWVRHYEGGLLLGDEQGYSAGWVPASRYTPQVQKLALAYLAQRPQSLFAGRREEWQQQLAQVVVWAADQRTRLLHADLNALAADLDSGDRDPLEIASLLADDSYPVQVAALLVLRQLQSSEARMRATEVLELLAADQQIGDQLYGAALAAVRA